MSSRAICMAPQCDRKRRMRGLCQRHLDQDAAGQPLSVIQRPLEHWEVAEEVSFFLSMGLSATQISMTMNMTHEALMLRLRKAGRSDIRAAFSNSRAVELHQDPQLTA